MYSKRIFSIMSLMIILALLLTACGTQATTPETESEMTVAGVVFQDDQFMKSMVQGFEAAGAEVWDQDRDSQHQQRPGEGSGADPDLHCAGRQTGSPSPR
jgi:ABC-type glycerol-3-phosphate transport system substrate-binding protein